MRGRFSFLVIVLALLLLASCGGGGGGTTVLPAPGNGNGGSGGDYPQHYTTDLDGFWYYDISNLEIDDPYDILEPSAAEMEADLEDGPDEFHNGRVVVGTPPFDAQITVNRVSKLSETQYEVVQRGTMTDSVDGETITIVIEIILSGFVNSAKTTWTGSGDINFWAHNEQGDNVYLASVETDFVATKGPAPGA